MKKKQKKVNIFINNIISIGKRNVQVEEKQM